MPFKIVRGKYYWRNPVRPGADDPHGYPGLVEITRHADCLKINLQHINANVWAMNQDKGLMQFGETWTIQYRMDSINLFGNDELFKGKIKWVKDKRLDIEMNELSESDILDRLARE